MNTDERRKKSLIIDFILKLILIIIFVLLLIKLVPWPNMDSLNPLKDQIFNANLQTMKEAGITYFTTERLPVEVGDKTTLSLQKMLDMKLLVPFTDKDGNSCDVKASYVSLEKKETEYLMKVNLKCGEEENYILVHLGCYSYCTTDICEAKPNNTEKPKNPSTNKPTPTNKPTTSPTPTHKPTTSPTPVVEKEYEYQKPIEATCNQWSNWSNHVTSLDKPVENQKTVNEEIEDLGIKKVPVGTISAVYENVYIERQEMLKTSTITVKLCNKYNYVADITKIYRVESDWVDATGPDSIKKGYRGDLPYDTIDTRWVLKGVDYNECKDNCVSNPYAIYQKQTRKVSIETSVSNVVASCEDIVEKNVDVYTLVPVGSYKKVLKTPAQTKYDTFQFYRVRTCDVISPAQTIYKWSNNNDQSLLSQGYKLTGNTRTK